jgi:hypothetical protein
MNLHEIPLKVVISLPQRSERRWKLHEKLCKMGITDLVCEHPVPVSEITGTQYSHLPKTALPYVSQILTLQKLLKESRVKGRKAIWILEDDAAFHPEFHDRVRRLRVPNNWQFLYLGGAYYDEVIRINESLVSPNKILDLHSVIIANSMFEIIEARFEAALKDVSRQEIFADVLISEIHKEYPAYLCRPNLVWQSYHQSDLNGRNYSNYAPDGQQWHRPSVLPFTAVFSCWTKNDVDSDRWGGREVAVEKYLNAAHAAQANFSRVVLYTDKRGRELLSQAIYDEIFTTLDDLSEELCHPSAAKMDTIVRQTEPFIYMDPNDFLSAQPSSKEEEIIVLKRRLTTAKRRQSVEWMKALALAPDFIEEILSSVCEQNIPCANIVGGRDLAFLKWYGQTAVDILMKSQARKSRYSKLKMEIDPEGFDSTLLWLCSLCRGKDFYRLTGDLVGAKENQRKRARKQSHSNADGEHIEKKATFRDKQEYIKMARLGKGWYIDIHRTDYKAVLGKNITEHGDEYRVRLPNIYSQHQLQSLSIERNGKRNSEAVTAITSISSEGEREGWLTVCNEAIALGANRILLINDGVKYDPLLLNAIKQIKVPFDWQFIYLGGNSVGQEERINRGLLKATAVIDFRAVLVERSAAKEIVKCLTANLKGKESCDERIATLHGTLPTYLCQPEIFCRVVTD